MLAAIGVESVDELFRDIPAGVRLRPRARPRAAALGARALAHLRSSRRGTSTRRGAVVPRRRHLRPLRPRGRRRGAPARRVPDGVHAVPAGDEPGRAAGDLRVPDRDLRAHGHGRLERVRLRRDRPSPPTPASSRSTRPALEGRRHRGDEPAGSPGREDVRARVRARGRRGAAPTAARPTRTSWPPRPTDAAAVIFQQPNFFGVPRARARAAPRPRTTRARSPIAHVDPLSLGVLEAPGRYGCAIAIGEGQAAGQLPGLRRPALRLPRGPQRLHPPHAGPDRRRDDRRRGQARLRPDAADARAAHPPREGDVEHHDEPDAARARRARHLSWLGPQGLREVGETCMRLAAYAKQRLAASSSTVFPDRPTFKEFAVRVGRSARDVDRATRARAASIRATRSAATTRGSTTRCSSPHREAHARRHRPARRGARRGGRMKLIYEKSQPGRRGGERPAHDACPRVEVPDELRRASRRACPSCASRSSSATSPRSRPATSGSTPASTRSAPAR